MRRRLAGWPGIPDAVQQCLLYRTFDYGDSAPTACGWWAVDRNENVFAYREYYQPNALISTHRANIAGLSVGERYECSLACEAPDPCMPRLAVARDPYSCCTANR